ncbi:unnamed protein product [Rotaria sordida]|uniref:F-box domain-containing protein n=1 Tax=Rotaria sordida TaxID=392033 RepID=A0A815TSC0_9BILA|nr:unnamed protein product [Rotaria sordida]
MEHSCIQLDDLPDEILMIIFQKLNQLELLLSLGVNKRLKKIAYDQNFTSHLTLFKRLSNDDIQPLPDRIVDRFRLEILPQIHHKIMWLELESISMERILLTTNYPNLCRLGLHGIDVEKAILFFTDDAVFTQIIKNQLSSLFIDISENKKQIVSRDIPKMIFTQIFTIFTNLQHLNFNASLKWYQRLSFGTSSPTIVSSTLLELHVCVEYFSDCLYLLDGRFQQLRIFHVNIFRIFSNNLTMNSKEKLHNLKYFYLCSDTRVHFYDELIVPLLHRMLNLERLDLHLKVDRYKGFIDGNDLKKDIINYMPRLNQFTFNIRLFNRSSDQNNIPLNEEIQDTFKDFMNNQIISCADYFQESHYSYCLIYSHPYRLEHYDNISNNFPGGLFKYVYEVSLHDERPFEHAFFLRIAQSFPFMRKLSVINNKPQRNKSENDNQDLLIIKYSHLTELNLLEAHDDYIELFLLDTKLYLPNNVHLIAHYESLRLLTDNFQRDATRINCAKMEFTSYDNVFPFPTHFKDYFLHVDMPRLR